MRGGMGCEESKGIDSEVLFWGTSSGAVVVENIERGIFFPRIRSRENCQGTRLIRDFFSPLPFFSVYIPFAFYLLFVAVVWAILGAPERKRST